MEKDAEYIRNMQNFIVEKISTDNHQVIGEILEKFPGAEASGLAIKNIQILAAEQNKPGVLAKSLTWPVSREVASKVYCSVIGTKNYEMAGILKESGEFSDHLQSFGHVNYKLIENAVAAEDLETIKFILRFGISERVYLKFAKLKASIHNKQNLLQLLNGSI